MERGSKRKAALASSPPSETRASKRQKTPEPRSVQSKREVQNNVQQVGIRWIEQARKARDSSTNLVATEFLTLPSRNDFPDYYAQIVMPLAIDTIEDKINANEYDDISAIESDVKRMIYNAKEYNEPGSDIFQNAERMRKMTHNFMKANNPAYGDKDYQAKPTPLPEDGQLLAKPKPVNTIRLTTGKSTPSRPAARTASTSQAPTISISKQVTSPVPAVVDAAAASVPAIPSEGYEGKTFQQAQEQLMEEMIHHHDEGGDLEVFNPFVHLPSRKIVDYYQTIKEPTSLNGVRKKVRGIHGRNETTGVSDFRTWDNVENEVRKIWNNARTYNEDGSEIFELSKELEQVFKARLAEARKHVSEPPQPILKLSVGKPAPPPGLRLNFGAVKASPAPSGQGRTSETPGISVDETSLQRQEQAVRAASGGVSHVNGDARAGSRPSSQGSGINGVKSEALSADSIQPSMLPPRVPNGLPNGVPAHLPPTNTSTYHAPAPTGFDNKFRGPGRHVSTALITELQIVTSPMLGLSKALNVCIPAHEKLTQQTVTLNLPSTHFHLQFLPTIAPAVTNNSKRPYRLFVTADGMRISPSHNAYRPTSMGVNGENGTNSAPTNAGVTNDAFGPTQPPQVFDVKLNGAGVHRIEVECVAVAEGALGAGTLAGKGGLEMERVSVFVSLLRG